MIKGILEFVAALVVVFIMLIMVIIATSEPERPDHNKEDNY